MADLTTVIGAEAALTFMVSAGLVYEVVAAACSSPQTAEINANKRAKTLMKWVYLGLAQAAFFVAITAMLSPQPWAAIAGGVIAGSLMLASYWYAKKAGLRAPGPGTES